MPYEAPLILSGSHHEFHVEKRGVCFGAADTTVLAPEVDHWSDQGALEELGVLVAWSRDIARGNGCDDHRFNTVQGKFRFDVRDLEEDALVTEATLSFTVREERTPSNTDDPRVERVAVTAGHPAPLEDDCFDSGDYFAHAAVLSRYNSRTGRGSFIGNDLDTGPQIPNRGGVNVAGPTEIFTTRTMTADVTSGVVREMQVVGDRTVEILIAPRQRLDPGSPGNVIPPRFDHKYCAAYITDATLQLEVTSP